MAFKQAENAMISSKEIEDGFIKELKELLKKYNAEITLEESESRPYMRGEDHIKVYIGSVWDGNKQISESVDIDLGRYVYSD